MLEERLMKRLALFDRGDVVDADLVTFVRGELERLNVDSRAVTDDEFGSFATHLMMALQRARKGEALASDVDGAAAAAELSAFPSEVREAKLLAERARQQCAVALPEQEITFVALHLAAVTLRERSS